MERDCPPSLSVLGICATNRPLHCVPSEIAFGIPFAILLLRYGSLRRMHAAVHARWNYLNGRIETALIADLCSMPYFLRAFPTTIHQSRTEV